MSNLNKKKFTTKVQLTDKQQKAVEKRSLGKRRFSLQEVAAKEKAKETFDSKK